MPLVDSRADVTLVVLVYKSLKWLDFVMDGVNSSQNETRYRWLVVANDATEAVRNDPRVSVDWQNENPEENYIRRVYRAWSEGILNARTPWVILLNTDMRATDNAIDELVLHKIANPKALPCGLLVESGRIPSGMPEYVKNFGTTPETFKETEFRAYADSIRKPASTEPGRLFQPVLLDRQEYFDLGGYPDGNIGGVSGDRILFNRYVDAGFDWVTCKGSIFYHCQEGEMRDA